MTRENWLWMRASVALVAATAAAMRLDAHDAGRTEDAPDAAESGAAPS